MSKVYFVSAPGRIKIGFTRRPEHRLARLQQQDMEPLEVIGITDGSRADEASLHALVKAHRLRGEWFADNAHVREVVAGFLAGTIKFEPPPKAEPADVPRDAADEVIDVAMGELRFLLDEIERRQKDGVPSSDLVWFAKFLTDEVIDPLTSHTANVMAKGRVK